MEEKILTTKKSGMPVLLVTILLYIAAIPLCVLGFSMQHASSFLLWLRFRSPSRMTARSSPAHFRA